MQWSRIPTRVFLAHSHEDIEVARLLAHELEENGATVWFAERMLTAGEPWRERIEEAMRNSDVFLVLLSEASLKSAGVGLELEVALASDNRTRVVGVRLGETPLPTSLEGVLYLDADPDDLGSAAKRVLQRGDVSSQRSDDPQRVHMTREVVALLADLGLKWEHERAIAGVRPDLLAESPDGRRLVIELKMQSQPTVLDAVHARTQAARLQELTSADAAVVVYPHGANANPELGLLALGDLRAYLGRFLRRPRPPAHGAGERPEPATGEEAKTVFASMPFAPQYDDVYWVAMTAAAEAVGAACVRVDREDFDGDIPTTIKNYIESSIAVVADLSESNADVLFELGYARRHGCPCVQICSSPLDDLPFNVRNFNTLAYNQGQTHVLKTALTTRLKAVLDGEPGSNLS